MAQADRDVPLSDMGFGRLERFFQLLGVTSSSAIVEMFYSGKLVATPGLGQKCVEELKKWIEQNKLKPFPDEPPHAGNGEPV